jgi:glycosyltransferase involved in cell wall biosynthesis
MKVARTIESFYPFVSGPAKQALEISKRLGIDSPIYTTDYMAKGSPSHEIYDGVKVFRLESTFKFMRYIVTPGLRKALEDAEIIHAHNYRSYQTQVAFNVAKKKGIPFIINTHGSLLGYQAYLTGLSALPYKAFDIIGRKQIMQADKVIVSSKFEIDEALRFGVPKHKIELIPMGIDVDAYETKRKPGKALRLLFVGRISRNRNLEPIIKAMDKLEGVSLRIVGDESKSSAMSADGYLDELKAMAKGKPIEFVGAKFGNDLIREYKQADVFVYTSLSENFGQCILEAGASGLPLITTRVGVANELVDQSTGFLVDFDDPKPIRKHIETLKSKQIRDKLGNNISIRVKERFSWDSIISRYRKLYKDVSIFKKQDTAR